MKHQEGNFTGADEKNIYYQYWQPENEPKAVLLLVHGIGEHSGRYMNVVNRFIPNNYAVYGFDHIGHGKSEGLRVYIEKFENFTDTIKIYYDMIREWHKDIPIILIGHSMGGLISAVYLIDHQEDFKGAVLSGASAIVPANISSATIFIGKILANLLPKVGIVELELDGVCRDPAVIDAYLNDPLVYTGKTTARLAAELLSAMQRLKNEANKITLPIQILHGAADILVDPQGSQFLYDWISSSDKTIKFYDGLYHEIFNEPEKDQVLDDVSNWIEAHLEG